MARQYNVCFKADTKIFYVAYISDWNCLLDVMALRSEQMDGAPFWMTQSLFNLIGGLAFADCFSYAARSSAGKNFKSLSRT